MGWLIGGGYKLVLIGLLVAGLVGLYFRYEHFVAANQELRDEVASVRAGMASQLRANDQLRGQNEVLDKITTQQAHDQADLVKALGGIRSDLNGLKKSSEEIRKWASAPMPIDIYRRLLDDGTDNSQGDEQAKDPRGTADKVRGPKDSGADKRGPVRVRPGPQGSAEGVQQAH